jgi:integrase
MLTPARLRLVRDTLAARPGSIATKNLWLTYTCMICRWAAKNPAIPLAENPAEGLERFREHGTRGGDGMNRPVTRDEVFNDADMEAMIAYHDTRSGASTSIMLRTAFGTGLRKGEIAGLRWADVDFERRTAHVCRTYDRRETKSGEDRSVPLPVALVTALRTWKASSPYKRDHHPCFPTSDGEHRGECWGWSETVKRVALGAGVARPGMKRWGHLTRHSYATAFLLKGGRAPVLARILGHAGVDLIFKTYSHIGETDLLDEINRIGLGEAHQKATVTELNRVKPSVSDTDTDEAIG